jgi:hypothetical protein
MSQAAGIVRMEAARVEVGRRLARDMRRVECRRNSPRKGIGCQALGILTRGSVDIPFPSQSLNRVGSVDFWTDLEAGQLRDLSPWSRNDSLFVELAKLAF